MTPRSSPGPWPAWPARRPGRRTPCAGTPVSVNYHVASNGTVVYDGATGATATEKAFGTGFMASFDKNRVALFTSLVHRPDGTYALFVHGRSGNCGLIAIPGGLRRDTPQAFG